VISFIVLRKNLEGAFRRGLDAYLESIPTLGVDRIMDHRGLAGADLEYHVRWVDGSLSWEVETMLQNEKVAVAAYQEGRVVDVGVFRRDDRVIPPFVEVMDSDSSDEDGGSDNAVGGIEISSEEGEGGSSLASSSEDGERQWIEGVDYVNIPPSTSLAKAPISLGEALSTSSAGPPLFRETPSTSSAGFPHLCEAPSTSCAGPPLLRVAPVRFPVTIPTGESVPSLERFDEMFTLAQLR